MKQMEYVEDEAPMVESRPEVTPKAKAKSRQIIEEPVDSVEQVKRVELVEQLVEPVELVKPVAPVKARDQSQRPNCNKVMNANTFET